MRSPERMIQAGGQGINLVGDLFAAMEYAEATEGDSFEDAFFELRPAIEAEEKGEAIKGRFNPRPYVDLLFGFSAKWRDESGWNRKHAENSDAEVPFRKRGPYKALCKQFSSHQLRELRPLIFGLLLETILPPEATAENGEAQRSEDTSPESESTGA